MSIVKLNNNGIKNVTTLGSVSLGNMTFIKKLTASSSGTLSFVDGASSVVLDSTYKEYLFTFKDIHPSVDDSNIQFQMSIDGGSNYNVAVTSTCFLAQHGEDGNNGGLAYYAARDEAQGTGFHDFMTDLGNANDECGAGYLHLFNPSSTTFVKHFIGRSNNVTLSDYSIDSYVAGYVNTTTALTRVQFKMSSGTFDGVIKMYGVS